MQTHTQTHKQSRATLIFVFLRFHRRKQSVTMHNRHPQVSVTLTQTHNKKVTDEGNPSAPCVPLLATLGTSSQTACCPAPSKTLPPSLEWSPLTACPGTSCCVALGCFGVTGAWRSEGNLNHRKEKYLDTVNVIILLRQKV